MGRDIVGNFVNVNGGTTTISSEWKYSIKSYLSALISTGTPAQQNYAKALWNFGYYTAQKLEFDEDVAAYGGTQNDVDPWELPASKKAEMTNGDGTWTVSGIKVETGYKPKMHIKLNATGSATVEAYKLDGELVYKKTVSATSGEFFVITDIPTKYLTGNVKISMAGSEQVVTYGFGRYAKARQGKEDGNVFLWLMSYAYYLGEAFA